MISTYTLSAFAKSVELLQSIRANTAHLRFTQSTVPSKLKQITLSEPSDTNFQKSAPAKLRGNFFHRRKFHETPFRRFYKDVLDKFSRLKPLSQRRQDLQQWAVKKNCADLHILLTAIEFFLKSRSDAEKPSLIMVGITAADWYLVAVQCTAARII